MACLWRWVWDTGVLRVGQFTCAAAGRTVGNAVQQVSPVVEFWGLRHAAAVRKGGLQEALHM